MSQPIAAVGAYKRIVDSSAAISAGPCQLLGFYVASTTAGTVVIKDGGSSGTALSGTITPAAGVYHNFPANVGTSAYATLGGTNIDVTFFFAAGH